MYRLEVHDSLTFEVTGQSTAFVFVMLLACIRNCDFTNENLKTPKQEAQYTAEFTGVVYLCLVCVCT